MDKLENARICIQSIVHEHKKIQDSFMRLGVGEINPFAGPHSQIPVQDIYTDAIVGIHGQTIKSIFQKSGCYIFVPRDTVEGNRVFQLSGAIEAVEKCKMDLIFIIQSVHAYAIQNNLEISHEAVLKYLNLNSASGRSKNHKKTSLLDSEYEMSMPPAMKLEITKSEFKQERENSKEFLFDPFAAAYYSQFSEYVPGLHSI